MNESKFFEYLRKRDSGVFGTKLSQEQVDALSALLDAGAHLPNVEMAAVLGNVYHECKMKPLTESLYYTAKRMTQVWPSRFKSIAAAKPYARNPKALANNVYANRIGNGNEASGDGYNYRGRGYIQITGRSNYAKFGLDSRPSDALTPKVAARVAVQGMEKGMFTGKRLSNYAKGASYDFRGARAIVNGDGKRVGAEVAAHCRTFLSALEVSGRRPVTAAPIQSIPEAAKKESETPSVSLWAALIGIFTGKHK